MTNSDTSMGVEMGFYPIVIEVQEDYEGYRRGTVTFIMSHEEIPSGLAFKILQANVKVIGDLNGDTATMDKLLVNCCGVVKGFYRNDYVIILLDNPPDNYDSATIVENHCLGLIN
jgi:hypothetical protein